ncbi:MAG TPA: hypothetical protein DCM49_04730 [Lachnospiraceae bacterium]|nr:hypothetical protein [Lachnospiraceae bacterium]
MYYFNPDTIMTNGPKMSFDQKVSVSGTRSRDEYSGVSCIESHSAENGQKQQILPWEWIFYEGTVKDHGF